MTRSSDPLNYWQAHHRQTVLPSDGVQLREQPTMICYFASPFTDLATCGVYKDGKDHNLTNAYLRTTISQFLYEMQSQMLEPARNAGCICFGTRIIRTSAMTGFAFYKDPNQYIFNLGWLNITGYNPEQHALREFLPDFVTRTAKRLSISPTSG